MPEHEYMGEHFVFIVGSPRSGTTVTAEELAKHPDIGYFYEPYYMWNYISGSGEDDASGEEGATPEAINFIRRNALAFQQKCGTRFVIEQSPEESLKLDLIKKVLPKARYIHLVRDGYDCVTSIANEWEKRSQSVKQKNPAEIAGRVLTTLGRQPFMRFRLMQLWFELNESGLLRPWNWANKSKWKGNPGWGVRIAGWQRILEDQGQMALNAHQWATTVEKVLTFLDAHDKSACIQMRYEDLAREPEKEFSEIQRWIGVETVPEIGIGLNPDSIGKGRRRLEPGDVAIITPIISDAMQRLGYDLEG